MEVFILKKVVDFLTKKRLLIFIITIILAIGSGIAMLFVNINKDMTKYLPEDSQMKQGMDIMENEFVTTTTNETFKIMFEDLESNDKQTIFEELSNYEGVENVLYDENSADYNKENYTLYVIETKYHSISKTQELLDSIVKDYKHDYKLYSYYNNSEDNLLDFLIPIAVVIVIIILFIMSTSLIEVLLILSNIGIAIVLNMGTNIIFSSISDMTFSIAAVLQLVLSIDYSIILVNRYKQERINTDSPIEAMKKALYNAFKSITSSSLTTFVGLLALIFMSFTIGKDMGLVLAKGVLFSLICVFTLLPTLIIWSDKLLKITDKKYLLAKIKDRKRGENHV